MTCPECACKAYCQDRPDLAGRNDLLMGGPALLRDAINTAIQDGAWRDMPVITFQGTRWRVLTLFTRHCDPASDVRLVVWQDGLDRFDADKFTLDLSPTDSVWAEAIHEWRERTRGR